MDAICLVVAGMLRATLPTRDFTLAWRHSVEKTRWEERYRIDGADLILIEARIEGSGAGMEAPPEAAFDKGVWSWKPQRVMHELTLTHSTFTADYTVCWRQQCRTLAELTGASAEGSAVTMRPCRPGDGAQPR